MADRKGKPGKARAWSAKRAALAMSNDPGWLSPHLSEQTIHERGLTRAYLDGWQAALNSDDPIGDLPRERVRLNGIGAPKPTGTGKGGKRKSGEGRK